MSEYVAEAIWLVFVYQFPKGAGSPRVKVWRRLQTMGAIAIKNSVYVLPNNEQSREDFAWLLQEINSEGADGVILETRFVDGMDDGGVKELFSNARSEDYNALREEVTEVIATASSVRADHEQQSARKILQRVRKQFVETKSIDFFNAPGRDKVESMIRELERLTRIDNSGERTPKHTMEGTTLAALKNRVWVTRRGVKVDRIASAWLIKRWIDPNASFKFVSSKGYSPVTEEIRFDMFEAEFTHEGDLCTFEVLLRLSKQTDPGLQSIGEIVHDIDLKDGKFNRPETAGVANLLNGIIAGIDDDPGRIERGSQLFEDLYRSFGEVNL